MMDFKTLTNLLAELDEIEIKLKSSDIAEEERIELIVRKMVIKSVVTPELMEHAKIIKSMRNNIKKKIESQQWLFSFSRKKHTPLWNN